MSEILDPSHQPRPFNLPMSPDLGGTYYDFVREVSKDKLTFCVRKQNLLIKIALPGDKSFMHISVETLKGDRFLDAYYDVFGYLTSANLWFRRFYNQDGFAQRENPSRDVQTVYSQLVEKKADLMMEVDLRFQLLNFHYCRDNSTPDKMRYMSVATRDIGDNPNKVTFYPHPSGEINPITFCASFSDDMLAFGFYPNEHKPVLSYLSTSANVGNIYGDASPKDVRDLMDRIFIKS